MLVYVGFRCYRLYPELRWSCSTSVPRRSHRSPLLPRLYLPSVLLVYKARAPIQDCSLLPWIYSCLRIWRSNGSRHFVWYGRTGRICRLGTSYHRKYHSTYLYISSNIRSRDGSSSSRVLLPSSLAFLPSSSSQITQITRGG